MKNFRNFLAATLMFTVLAFGTSVANAGLLISDFTGGDTPEPCTEKSAEPDWGIIVEGFAGIIVEGFIGIIVEGATEENCGIIVEG